MFQSYEQFIDEIRRRSKFRGEQKETHTNLVEAAANKAGFYIEVDRENGGSGTNKETLLSKNYGEKPLQTIKKDFNSVATIILPKEDNWGHGKSAEEGYKIACATKILGHLTRRQFEDAIDFVNSPEMESVFGDKDELKKNIVTKIQELGNDPDQFKKLTQAQFRGQKVILRTTFVHALGIIEADARDGSQSVKKAWYLGKRLPGEVKPYEVDGKYKAKFAGRQAVADSLLSEFATHLFEEEGIKLLFGDKDPHHPKHMMEKVEYLLENDNRTLGVGASILLRKNNVLRPNQDGKIDDEQVIIGLKELENKGISLQQIYDAGKAHLEEQKTGINKLIEIYEEAEKVFKKKFDKGDRWVDNTTEEKVKKGKFKGGVFDHEEGGMTIPIFAAAVHISSLGGIDYETGQLNEVGKAILEGNRATGFLEKQLKKGVTLSEKETDYFYGAIADAAKYIEIMRVCKPGEFLFTARSSHNEAEKFVAAISLHADGVNPKTGRSANTNLKQAGVTQAHDMANLIA